MSTIELGNFNGTHNNLGFLSDSDPNAYYRFSLTTPASFSTSVHHLNVGVGVQLLNSNGSILQSSILSDTTSEAFEVANLAPGDYALHITSAGVDTAYNLSLNVDPLTSLPIDSGYFQVGKTGTVGFDFLLDGGFYEGEVAIFSLKGMEIFEPGSKAFIKEAAQRALSDSVEGHIVIQDSKEGAKFEADFPWEGNFNSGEYQKIKTFAMTPGDLFGVMLVPNGTVREVFQSPLIDGEKSPLFSLSTANPNDAFQFAQIADVFGNGTTFVMEDLRADNNPDKDYNDVVFNITGATGFAVNLSEVINPDKNWLEIEIGGKISQDVNKSPEQLQLIVQPVYQVGERISLTDTKVFDENKDVTQIKFWLKEDNGEWVEIENATHLKFDEEGWASFDCSFSNLEAGNYQLKAVAIDKIEQTSNEVIHGFRVNAIPSQLEFNLSKISYLTGEKIGITNGKVYDANGVKDLAKVDFWLQENNGNWLNVGTVTQFTETQEGWASFNFELLQELTTGTYKIKAIASDQVGKTCDEVIHDFVVNPVNEVPTDLQFSTNKPIFTTGEIVRLDGGKVYDANGGKDLKNVAFWLQKEGGEWVPIRNVTQFDLGTKDWAKFDYELKNLKAGNYQIKAVAYDQAGATSDPLIRSFIIAEEIQKPTTNVAPQYLQFALQSAYSMGEAVSLLDGKVYDENGAWNLNKVEFWLKKERGEWEEVAETTQFTSESEGWANFNYELTDLAVGEYQLKAVAYDKANAASNQVIQHFSILEESAPLPTNIPPQFLQFGLESFYQVGESIELRGGKVYDANGAENLAKIEFRIKKNEGKWKKLETITDFNSETGNWGNFNYTINNLTAGNYRIEAIAYDQAGAKSNIVLQTFTVSNRIIEPVNPRLYNRPPQGLVFSTFPLYTNAETISFSGAKVYDRDGTGDIERIDFWLQKPTGEWVDIQDATQFTVDNKDWNRFDFSYDLNGLTPGDYQLWAVAYDKVGNQSNIARENFTIITDAGEGGLSDTVRLAIADAADLRSYNPQILEQTREWVVWVTPGQSSAQLATQIGAEDLGETGHIDNTYIWKFPDNATPTLARNRLINLPGVEFAFPLVPVRLKLLYEPPSDNLFVDGDQWNIEKAGVSDIWETVQGTGVVIAIVDDGVEEHIELIDRYNQALSWDFNDNDPDASPTSTTTFEMDLENQEVMADRLNVVFNLPVNLTGKVTNVDVQFDLAESLPLNSPRPEDLTIYLHSPSEPADDPLKWRKIRSFHRFPGWHDLDFDQQVRININEDGSVEFNRDRFDGTYAGGNWQLEVRNPNLGQYSAPELQQLITQIIEGLSLTIETENPHGTAVAGISVATNNGWGIVGVAPQAELAALRLIGSTDPVNYDKDITGQTIADALFTAFRNQEIDIFNNSWGPMNMIQQSLAIDALENGAKQGRNGLGNIYIFAAGNDGALDGNVNYNYLANSRYSIAVGAVTRNDIYSPYSTPGASLLISAYSDDGSGQPDESIMTSGLDDWYANDFGGTSAAAPLVSGVVALMLEANPNLTWRDVQHILVLTAKRDGINDPEANWSGQEGDAIRHSDKYGFGILDAAAAVNMALNWMPVAPEDPVSREHELDSVTQTIPTLATLPVGDRETAGDSTLIEDDIKVESVEVELSITHPDWRDLTVILTSPTGTQSVLAKAIPPENRTADDGIKQGATEKYWTFSSVRHWGESSQGEWTLQVFDQQGNEVEGTWHNWKLNVYGTPPEPTVTIRTTDASGNEEGNAAQFVVTRDGNLDAPLTVNYTVAGTATNGTDYKQLTGTVTIEAGKASATIGAVPILDYLAEDNETVTLSLTDTNTYNLGAENSATATITNITPTDWYGPFVYVNPANGHLYLLSQPDTWLGAQEQAEALGGNLVTINDADEQNWLNETFEDYLGFIGLTDHEIYGTTEGDFVWTSGEALTYTNWQAGEPNNLNGEETVHANPANGGQWIDSSVELAIQQGWLGQGVIEIDPATLTQPIVNIHATDSQAGEDGNVGQIVITRIGNLDEDLTVNYTVAGTATNGVDYQELSGTATIAAGASFVTIPINALPDNEFRDNEIIAINLAEGDYQIGIKPVTEIIVGDENPVTRLFREVFGHGGESGYWTDRWQNGEPLDQIRWNIAHDGAFNEAAILINEIYQDLFGRPATEQEIADWRDRLGTDTTLSQVRQQLENSTTIIADSTSEFSFTQGQDNWYYGYYQGNLTSQDFRFLTNTDPEKGWIMDGTDYWNSTYWTHVGATELHPSGLVPSVRQSVEQWAVRRWVSEVDGEVSISGLLARPDIRGNGVIGRILVDGVEVWSQEIAGEAGATGVNYNFNTTVERGSIVDFVVDPNADDQYYDTTEFTATIAQVNPFIPTTNYVYTNPTNGHRYFLTMADTWLGAQEQAKAFGGNLVTINDADEQTWLVNTFGNESFWIGLTDSNLHNRQEGNFQWINGEPLTYTNWYLGEPSDQASAGFEGEDFAHIYPYPDEFADRWNDAIASRDPQFGIVEIDPLRQEDPTTLGSVGVVTIGATPIVDVEMGGEAI